MIYLNRRNNCNEDAIQRKLQLPPFYNIEDFTEFSFSFSKLKVLRGALCVPTFSNVKESWVLSSPEYLLLMGLGLADHRYAYCLWELSDANTQTLSGPLTLIRSVWCLEGQMVVIAIRAPGLTPLPIAGWLALGYEALVQVMPWCWTGEKPLPEPMCRLNSFSYGWNGCYVCDSVKSSCPGQMSPISQTTFSNELSWMKSFVFRFKFHWSLFIRVQLTISQHWFR